MLLIGEIVIFVGFFIWTHAVIKNGIGIGHFFSVEPLHFENFSMLASATALALLSYLGFDAIATLSEEAIHPKRDIPRAILAAVIIGCFTMCITGYIGMLVIPHWQSLVNDQNWLITSLFYIAKITGDTWFVAFYMAGFLLAMMVFNVVATAAASRLLYGMGRDEVLPKKIFGTIHPRWKTPYWNILVIITIEFLIGILCNLDSIVEVVSYGAIIGFGLLNFTVSWLYCFKKEKISYQQKSPIKKFVIFVNHYIGPVIGMIVMFFVFINLRHLTLIIGSIWLIIGIIHGAYRTDGYRKLPPMFHS